MTSQDNIKAILFDYGGVLAEEGFREGLMAIARGHGLSPEEFFDTSADAVYDTGYLLGKSDENAYWSMVKQRTGIEDSNERMRWEIMKRFVLRPAMIETVRTLRNKGYRVGILSDQTDWLDELDARDDFFKEFDFIFNSYYLGLGKRHVEIFPLVAGRLGIRGEEILFIDDNEGHISRAVSQGFRTILYSDGDGFLRDMERIGLLP